MENNIAVRTEYDPSGLSSLTAEAATSSPNGDAFSAVFASHSRTNFFEGQWGDDSKAMFENLMRQFDDELKDTKPDGGSKPPGSARRSSLPTGDKVCPEIVTEQKMVNGELKDVDFVTIHGRCNSDNSNGSNNTGQADGNPNTGAPPPTPNPNMALDPKLAEPEKGTQTLDYLKDSLEQLALGNYTDKVTVLGTGAQIATGLLGLDLPADIRDLTHDLTHWQWSWSHVGQTLLDGVGVLPVVGSIKYLDEAGALVKGAVKHVDETADMAKNAENAIDKISDIKGGILKSEDANVLENLEKTERKGYVRTDSPEGPKKTKSSAKYENRLDVKHRTADEVNAEFGPGWKPPYKKGTRVTEYTNKEAEKFIRVHLGEDARGQWMMRKEAIEGLSPEEIAKKYSLTDVPKYISEVNVPSGTRIRTGKVASNFGGSQGATQYQLLGRIPDGSFGNTRPLR